MEHEAAHEWGYDVFSVGTFHVQFKGNLGVPLEMTLGVIPDIFYFSAGSVFLGYLWDMKCPIENDMVCTVWVVSHETSRVYQVNMQLA